MHRTRLLALAFLVAIPSSAFGNGVAVTRGQEAPPAAAPDAAGSAARAWYLRNEVGANLIPDISLKGKSISDGVDTVSWSDASLSLDAGVGWNIAFGVRVADWLSFEVSSGLAYNQFDAVTGTIDLNGASVSGTLDVSGSILQVPIMAGPRAEFPIGEALRINVGVSAGGIYLHGDLNTTISDGATAVTLDGSDGAWAFAYSATAGLDWQIAHGLGLGVAYRFLGTTSASFGPLGAIDAEAIYNQQIVGTVTIRF